ncbi:MAG: hypothetical protein ACYC46_08650 [Acidobacteriaceae bacterium]
MRVLDKLVSGLIMAYGITQPTPAQRKVVTILVAGLMVGVLLLFAAMGALLLWHF